MPSAEEDLNLTEVKAVLKQLQRLDLSSDLSTGDAVAQNGATRTEAKGKSPNLLAPGVNVFDKKLAAVGGLSGRPSSSSKPTQNPRLMAGIAGGVIGLALISVVGYQYYFKSGQPKPKQGSPTGVERDVNLAPSEVAIPIATPHELGKENETTLLSETRKLLRDGDIVAARQRLLQGKPDELAEIAFILAQSYDPNYLQTLPKGNADPDREQAARWYRKWYQLALNSGLEMDSSRLQRIINAMH